MVPQLKKTGGSAEAKPGVQQRPLREGPWGAGLMEARVKWWPPGTPMMNEVELWRYFNMGVSENS